MSFPPRWQTPPPVYEYASIPGTTLKPYLTLPYLLSLVWLGYPILSLLFVAFRLQLSLSSAQDAVSDAKGSLLTSCKAAERAATAAASLPRYMAIGTNRQIVEAVNETMNGAREALILALTVMEAIINFVVDTYRSTLLCFIELVVRGGLSLLISAVQELQGFVTSSLNAIRSSIQNDIAAANSAIVSAINGINKVNPFGDIKAPQFNIPSLDQLENVTLPTDFEQALIKLNSSIPSLDDLRSKIESLIDTPFELVKKDINDTFLGISFNGSTLPVPPQNTLAFCGEMDTGVVDDLGRELVKVARIGVILLIVLALLLLAGYCFLEWYKWRALRRSLERTRQAWATDPTIYHLTAVSNIPTLEMSDHNLLTLHATSSHPLLTVIANKLSKIFRLSPSQYIHLQFFFHYVFHPPALACFLIGLFGLLSVELQLLALAPVQAQFSDRVAASVGDLSNTISASINASMHNQTSLYANSINDQVNAVQSNINDGLFGWVNDTTTTLNNTLVAFYNDVQSAMEVVFGGTPLEQPAQEFIRCFIGTKVDALENALTFLHNNLHVNFPTLNQDALLLSQDSVNEATRPISEAAVGGGPANSEGLVGRLVDRYAEGLRKERIMFSIFIGLWVLVVLVALSIIFWHSYVKGWIEARNRRKWEREQRGHVDPIARPWYQENALDGKLIKEKDTSNTPSPDSTNSSRFFAALRRSASHKELSPPEHSGPPISRFPIKTKLKAIGCKAFGKEVLVKDQDPEVRYRQAPLSDRSEDSALEIKEKQPRSWWQCLLRQPGLEKTTTNLERPIMTAPQPMYQRRPTQLTIETNIVLPSQRQNLPVVVQDEPSPHSAQSPAKPVSRFSVSPSAPKAVSWARPLPDNTLPARPNVKARPRLQVAVPQSVDSTYSPSILQAAHSKTDMPSKPGFGVPIHYAFVRPIPENTPSTPSPPTSPFGPSAVATPKSTLAPPPINARGRASLQVVSSENPFATCFDDEYAMKHECTIPLTPTKNPFADHYGTPRAV